MPEASWEILERDVANALGGVRTPGSGNIKGHEGDVKTSRFLVECKDTASASYRLTADEIDKARREAVSNSRESAFCVRLCSGSEQEVTVAVLEMGLFLEMHGAYMREMEARREEGVTRKVALPARRGGVIGSKAQRNCTTRQLDLVEMAEEAEAEDGDSRVK